jgi:hypothetical protein
MRFQKERKTKEVRGRGEEYQQNNVGEEKNLCVV